MFLNPNSVDGIYTEWSEWGACSKTCGRGNMERNRTCVGPFHGGRDCEGPDSEPAYCYPSNCPGIL